MAIRSSAGARLICTWAPAQPRMLTLVLHGGPEKGTSRCRWFLPQVLRCQVLAAAVARRWRRDPDGPTDIAVFRLQHSWTGWDGEGSTVLADARWALDVVTRRFPQVPIVILGHSMGGRTGVRLADSPQVLGVVGLAPWLPDDDPVAQLTDRRLTIVQGSRDRELPVSTTVTFVARARAAGVVVKQLVVRGGGHFMLIRMGTWDRQAADEVVALIAAR